MAREVRSGAPPVRAFTPDPGATVEAIVLPPEDTMELPPPPDTQSEIGVEELPRTGVPDPTQPVDPGPITSGLEPSGVGHEPPSIVRPAPLDIDVIEPLDERADNLQAIAIGLLIGTFAGLVVVAILAGGLYG